MDVDISDFVKAVDLDTEEGKSKLFAFIEEQSKQKLTAEDRAAVLSSISNLLQGMESKSLGHLTLEKLQRDFFRYYEHLSAACHVISELAADSTSGRTVHNYGLITGALRVAVGSLTMCADVIGNILSPDESEEETQTETKPPEKKSSKAAS